MAAPEEGPWAVALRAKRVQWEHDMPLNDIITVIDAEGLLGQYCYEDIKAKDNMIEKRRALIDFFLTKDESCIARLDEVVQHQGGFEHLKLDVSPTPILPLERGHVVEETDSYVSPHGPSRTLAATPFSISEFLKKHETEFFKVVYPKLSLLRLIRKGVITEDVKSKIDASNTEDGQEILFSHLKHHADVDSLMEYCEVVIAADGYPNMQALGTKLKKELQQGDGVATSRS